MEKITKNFSLQEFTKSHKAETMGIHNEPNEQELQNLKMLCKYVLQPLRDAIKRPMIITSGYRSAALNQAIGGARGSQHTLGQAADFITANLSEAFSHIRRNLIFDQVIWENHPKGAWIHVSYKHGSNRQQALFASFLKGRAEYILLPNYANEADYIRHYQNLKLNRS
jgi:zinc D-Ala-D-Ala carboxypeptidase